MLTKEKLIKTINELPEKFSVDDLLDRIILMNKIEVGLEQSKSGKTFSTEQARERLQKWL